MGYRYDVSVFKTQNKKEKKAAVECKESGCVCSN